MKLAILQFNLIPDKQTVRRRQSFPCFFLRALTVDTEALGYGSNCTKF